MHIRKIIGRWFSGKAVYPRLDDDLLRECSSACKQPHMRVQRYSLVSHAGNSSIFSLKDKNDKDIGVFEGAVAGKTDDRGRPIPARRKGRLSFTTFRTMIFESEEKEVLSSFVMTYYSGLFSRTHFLVQRWSDFALIGAVAFMKNAPPIRGPNMTAEIRMNMQGPAREPDICVVGESGEWYGFLRERTRRDRRGIFGPIGEGHYHVLLKSMLSPDQKSLILASLLVFKQQFLCEGFGIDGG